ncbi:MAG: LCP family protein [Bacilli bacterium]|nr:LCP family protein [Bacilli bacterium]
MEKKKKKTKSKKTKNKNKTSKKIVSRIINVLSIVAVTLFLWYSYHINIIPMKYYRIAALSLVGFEIIYTLLCINKKKSGIILKLFNVLALLFIIGCGVGYWYLNKTVAFIEENFKKNYTYDEYYILTNKDSSFNTIKDIKGKTIYYNVDTDYYAEIKTELKKKTTAKISKVDSLSDSLGVLAEPDTLILLSSGLYDSISTYDEGYINHIKIVDTIRIIVPRVQEEKEKEIDLTNTPFIIYLSGIDTRTETLVKKSLSDVNMFIVVNPNTKTILLVSIPRDSYVPLHGYNGRKDKLTHAGSLGGLELSKATSEDVLDIHADYYARVNFRAVVNLVDAVGGVVVQEEPYITKRFSCWTNRKCWIEPGENYLTGECALAFARERYHYYDGDMQRNKNQQKVLQALFNKLSSSTYMVAHYDKFLNAVAGTFETDMSPEDIKKLIKFQLNDMSPWTFESQNVVGGTGRTTTYSSGSTELSVVYPNQKSINEAKEAIRKVLAGESLHPEENTTTEGENAAQ